MGDDIVVNVVGDVSFGDLPLCIGHGINSTAKRFGSGFLFEKVRHLFIDGDINVCNLETILSDHNIRNWYLLSREMRGFPACVKALKDAKINLVNIANNHTLQHGKAAFYNTLGILRENNIAFIGFDEKAGTNIFIYEKGLLRVGIISFSLKREQYFKGKAIYSYRSSAQALVKEIQRIRSNFNGILLVSLHWGHELMHFPSKDQVLLAHQIIDTGVSAILGHHPHVLQGIEEYKRGLIAYSLGNFLFDLWDEATKQSIILKIKIDKKGIKDFALVPVFIDENYRPREAPAYKAEEVIKNMKKYQTMIFDKSLNLDSNEYMKLLRQARNNFRIGSYKYFIRNIRLYPLNMLIQIIFRAFFRRILKCFRVCIPFIG